MPLLDFTLPHLEAFELPAKKQNLSLILWAGDGQHGQRSDVSRLNNFLMYLCRGYNLSEIHRNMEDLSPSQTICRIDASDEQQLLTFYKAFDGAFSYIDSDYYGNTPKLPLETYVRLLKPGGLARNIEGISGMHMPFNVYLNKIELLAPVLSPELLQRRLWSKGILDLALRDELTPAQVWTSSDLQISYYDEVRRCQEGFQQVQKGRFANWPLREATLEEHWEKVSLNTLTDYLWRSYNTFEEMEVNELLEKHLPAFDEFLSKKIEALRSQKPAIDLVQADYEKFCAEEGVKNRIYNKQKIIKWFMYDLPVELVGSLGYYKDARRRETVFGLTIVKNLQ